MNLGYLILLTLLISSCGKGKIHITLFGNLNSLSSSVSSPSSLSLTSPITSPNTDSTPTIQVDGVQSGDIVKLFSNASCSSEVGQAVASGSSVDVTTNTLTINTYTFYATTTRSGLSSSCSTSSLSYSLILNCPTGYISVPGNSTLSTDEFCVMQYEAKAWNDINTNSIIDGGEIHATGQSVSLGSHVPASVADNQPWREINANDATAECESLGTNYHLISNPEWMTIARNAENIDANWTGGSVGSGCMFRGNSGDTSCGYDSAIDPDSGASRNARAIFTLSNEEQIYDLAGNVYSWVDWNKDTAGFQTGPTSCSTSAVQLPSVACGALVSDDYDTANGTYTTAQGVGLFVGGAGGAALRGGTSSLSGAFALILFNSPTDLNSSIGFRCVYRPPSISIGTPTPTTGDSGDTFSFPVTVIGSTSVNLQASDITVNTTGSVSCDTPLVKNGTTTIPTVEITNCSGFGTVGITIGDSVALDALGNTSPQSSASTTASISNCPSGYVLVPGNGTLGTSDFCVMQFEAKAWNDINTNLIIDGGEVDTDGLSVSLTNHLPISIPENSPWVGISAYNSATECESLGANYHLISNPEWMTIARNVENVDANWTGGSVGSGCIFRGNSGETTCGYNGANPESGSSRNSRAMLTLSNGLQVSDLSGNVYEWTDWDMDNQGFQIGPTTCSTDSWTEFPLISCPELSSNDYDTENGSYDSSEGIGMFYADSGGAAVRGGFYFGPLAPGVFSLNLANPPTLESAIGFRCVYRP